MIKYVCGIDVGSQSCAGCVCRPDKSLVGKPMTTALGKEGWDVLLDKLSHLDALPQEILIGMEATARYSENLYHALEQYGYRLCLLHPGQTHQFHKRQGLRAKTDRLDAMTIARVLLSGEARSGYIRSRTSGDLPRIGAPAQSIERAGGTLPKSDPCPGGGPLPRVHPGLCRSLLADGLSRPQSLSKSRERWPRRGKRRSMRSCTLRSTPIMGIRPPRSCCAWPRLRSAAVEPKRGAR